MIRLYRGTNRYNKTNPDLYNKDGLLTKQVNSGDDPEPHKKYGGLKVIANHILFRNEEEKFIYDTTQFLSFSSDRSVAEGFIGGKTKRTFVPCNKLSAEAYLFINEIDWVGLEEIGHGLFRYLYSCNYNRNKMDPKFSGLAAQFCRCNICDVSEGYLHSLLLIDVEKCLSRLRFDYPEEYQNAQRDKEWLLMPADPMVGQNAIGFQSRVAIAYFWTVDFYKYLS